MTNYERLLEKYRENLKKALGHLRYSFKKIQTLPTVIKKLDEEELETWESFVARFSRASDIFISKYLRTCVERHDPGFKGSVRDILNQAEKLNCIESVHDWLVIRELRNKAAHNYDDETLEKHFEELRKLAPFLLDVEKKLT